MSFNNVLKIIVFVLCFEKGTAQTFNKSVSIDSLEIESANGIVITDDKYYFLGVNRTNGPNPSNLGVELFTSDLEGNILRQSKNKQANRSFGVGYDNNFIQNGVNDLIFATTEFITIGSTSSYQAVITSYDTLLNINWQKNFISNISFFRTMQRTPEGHLLVLGEARLSTNGPLNIYLIKLDSLGNEIWRKTYGNLTDQSSYSLRILEDNNYLIGGLYEYTSWPDMDGWLIKTDTAGNVIWDNYLESPGADYGIHLFADNYFYQAKDTFYTFAGGGPAYEVSYFGEIDDLGEVLWTEELERKESQFIKCALKLSDGGFLIVQSYIDFDYGGNVSWLIKFDEERNKVWERYYFADNARSNGLVDVAEDDDGNLVFIGTILTTDTLYNADIWLLKLNADGCLDATDCGEPIGILDLTIAKEVFGIQVNPNPVKDQAKIIIKNSGNFIGENIVINIYNPAGKQVHHHIEKLRGQLPTLDLNVSNYTRGIYYIKASVNGQEYGNGKFVKE